MFIQETYFMSWGWFSSSEKESPWFRNRFHFICRTAFCCETLCLSISSFFLESKRFRSQRKRERISQTFVLFKEMPDKETDNSSQEIFQVSLNQSLQQLHHEVALYQRCQPSLFINHKKIVVANESVSPMKTSSSWLSLKSMVRLAFIPAWSRGEDSVEESVKRTKNFPELKGLVVSSLLL